MAKTTPDSLPVIPLSVDEKFPLFERGFQESPFIVEERQSCTEVSGWDLNVTSWAHAMVDRAFAKAGAGLKGLGEFDKSNKVCVRVWIERG